MNSERQTSRNARAVNALFLELNELFDDGFPVLNPLNDNSTCALIVIVEGQFLPDGIAKPDLLEGIMNFLRFGAAGLIDCLRREPKRIVTGPSLEHRCA